MAISSLTRSQIQSYNLINAFALPRSDHNVHVSKAPLTTGSLQQSLGLLSTMQSKLEMLQGNLSMMYQAATAITPGSSDEKKLEAYAQLRSMSAGVDQLVQSTKVEGKALFAGTNFELNSGAGSVRMSLDDLASSDEDGLGLAYDKKSAFTKISYDMLSLMRNSSSSLMGLDISEAIPSEVAEYKGELEDGDYQLKVTYQGPDSIVEVQNLDGTTINKVEGVDLSGTGQELVDLGVGFSLSFEKTYFETVLGNDKYDYDLLGPTALYARLSYQRNDQHILDDGTERKLVTQSSVSVIRGENLKGTTGTLGVGASIAGVQKGMTSMDSGQYRVQVRYAGDKSSVWLYDKNGSLVSTKRNVDLTQNEKVSVDMETGVKLTFDPKDFTSDKSTYNTYLDYKAADVPADVFDYEAYADKIAEALGTLQEQMNVVGAAQQELQSRFQLQQQGSQASASASGASVMAQGALSLISAASTSDASGLFSMLAGNTSKSSDSGLVSIFDSNIMGSLESITNAQANVDPAILARLR